MKKPMKKPRKITTFEAELIEKVEQAEERLVGASKRFSDAVAFGGDVDRLRARLDVALAEFEKLSSCLDGIFPLEPGEVR